MRAGGPSLGLVLLAACHVEDRGVAADVAVHYDLMHLRDALECYREETGEYPAELQDLVDRADCTRIGGIARRLATVHEYGGRLGHRWRYTGRRAAEDGAVRGFSLSVEDVRGRDWYRSFWLDESGVIRSAKGRPATPGDPPEERQQNPPGT